MLREHVVAADADDGISDIIARTASKTQINEDRN